MRSKLAAVSLMMILLPPPAFGQAAAGLSALLDPVAPSLFDETPVAGLTLRRSHAEPLTRRLTDGDAWLLERNRALDLFHETRPGALRLGAGLRLRDDDLSVGYGGRDGGAELSGEGRLVEALLRIRHAKLSAELRAPIWCEADHSTPRPRRAALAWSPRPRWRLELHRAVDRLSTELSGWAKDDALVFPLDLSAGTLGATAAMPLGDRLDLRGGWTDLDVGTPRGLRGIDDELIPDGGGASGHLGLDCRVAGDHLLTLDLIRRELDVEAEAFRNGAEFADLSYIRVEQTARRLAWHIGEAWRLAWTGARIDAAARLKVQSWPFTPAIIDLLGQSRTYHGTLDLDLHRWELSFGGLSLIHHDITPTAVLKSWRPVVLGVGATDVKRSDLEVERIRLLSAGWDLRRRFGDWAVSFVGRQYLWADITEIEAAPSTEPGGDSPASESDDGWLGGTWLGLTITRYFH